MFFNNYNLFKTVILISNLQTMLVGFFCFISNNTPKKLYKFIFFDLIAPCKTV